MRAPLAASDNSPDGYELRDPDVRLMLEVRNDNAAAFEELMLRYQNRLVTVLDHLVGGRDQAEDLRKKFSCACIARGSGTRRERSFRPGCSRSPTTWPRTPAAPARAAAR